MASEAVRNSVPVLRRWASFDPETPLPSDFKKFEQVETTKAVKLQQSDPELYQLLSGTAPAGLVADAISYKLSPVPPDASAMAEQAHKAEVAELTATNPYASGNLTAALRLERIDPKTAAEMRKAVNYRNHAEREQDAAEAAEQKAQWLADARRAGQLRSLAKLQQQGF